MLPQCGHFTGALNIIALHSMSNPINFSPQLSHLKVHVPRNIGLFCCYLLIVQSVFSSFVDRFPVCCAGLELSLLSSCSFDCASFNSFSSFISDNFLKIFSF